MVEERSEDGITFLWKEGLFYNPHMRLSRLLSSLAVGAIGEPLYIFDGFTATGVRGLRYAVENANVKEVTFNDILREALEVAEENAKRHNIPYNLREGKAEEILWREKHRWNFIELDPFGSPHPYIYAALKHLSTWKRGWLSFTATDTGVLCGIHWKATLKHYCLRPFHVPYCHEYGLRGLLSYVARMAAPFNLRVIPLFAFYYRHQIKVMVELRRGEDAHENLELEHIHYCRHCGESYLGWVEQCPHCSRELLHGGPIWHKPFADPAFVERMERELERRNVRDREKVAELLRVIKEEQPFPPWHVSSHEIAKRLSISPLKVEALLSLLREKGIPAARTHFDKTAVKFNAPLYKVLEVISNTFKPLPK